MAFATASAVSNDTNPKFYNVNISCINSLGLRSYFHRQHWLVQVPRSHRFPHKNVWYFLCKIFCMS